MYHLVFKGAQIQWARVQRSLGMTEGFDIALEMSGNAAAFGSILANMAHGGRVHLARLWEGYSTTRTLQKLGAA